MRVAFVRRVPYGSLLHPVAHSNARSNGAVPARLDVVDKGDRFALQVDLPGLSKEDINVAVEGARVSVSGVAGNTTAGGTPEQIKVLRAERPATSYARTVELPAEVDADKAQASFENGVL